MNTNTETMSPADVIGKLRDEKEKFSVSSPRYDEVEAMEQAVAALIEREAALESKLEGARIACANLTDSLNRAEAERDALAERVKALEICAEALCDALTEGAPGDDHRAYDELRRLLRAEASND